MSPRIHGYLWLLIAYFCAASAGYAAFLLSPWPDPLWAVAFADGVATVVVFAFSYGLSNSSFYDPYWSLSPAVFALVWFGTFSGNATRALVMIGLIAVWGLRLTVNFLRGFSDITHCDWRYRDLETQHGPRFWWVSFFGIHLFSTVLVFLGLIPVYLALQSGSEMGPVDWLAAGVTLGAIAIEGIADRQLHQFVQSNEDSRRFMATGLWSWSRHPNYFGEVSFWWGLAVFGLAASGSLWSVVGGIAMTLLFVFISIPLMEARMLKKRPHYAEHIKQVSALIPLPPQKGA
jgi:steroid 5-alpha reductase family enzyme